MELLIHNLGPLECGGRVVLRGDSRTQFLHFLLRGGVLERAFTWSLITEGFFALIDRGDWHFPWGCTALLHFQSASKGAHGNSWWHVVQLAFGFWLGARLLQWHDWDDAFWLQLDPILIIYVFRMVTSSYLKVMCMVGGVFEFWSSMVSRDEGQKYQLTRP